MSNAIPVVISDQSTTYGETSNNNVLYMNITSVYREEKDKLSLFTSHFGLPSAMMDGLNEKPYGSSYGIFHFTREL